VKERNFVMTELKEKQRLHVIVHGRVQAVNFRYTTLMTARDIGVTGWVQNRPDQTVEVMAEGTRYQLERLLDFLHIGPNHAQVTAVDVNWNEATGEFKAFSIR
jgi:acylphosphatase